MNKKLLLLVFSIVTVVSCGLMGEGKKTRTNENQKEIAALLTSYSELGDSFRSCVTTDSTPCDLVIKHLKNACDHQQKQNKIKYLEAEKTYLASEQTQRPVQNRLDKAKKECPGYDKKYWQLLEKTDQDSLIDAAAEIAEEEDSAMHSNINGLKCALNK